MEITTIHLDMVQSVALAIVSYYIGMDKKPQRRPAKVQHSGTGNRRPAFCAGIFAFKNLRHCRFYL